MSKRFNNSLFILQRDFGEVYLMQPEYLVIQVGIVDCWSRKDGSYICEEFRGKDPWISEHEYINYIKQFIINCMQQIKSLKAIIVVNITKAKKDQYDRHLGSHERTVKYNEKLQILKELDKVFIADVYDEFDKDLNNALCSDGVHPSSHGNYIMAKKIFDIMAGQIYYNNGIISLNKKEIENSIKYFKKSYEYCLFDCDIYWNSLNKLISLYLSNKCYEELGNTLFPENISKEIDDENKNYKEIIISVSKELKDEKYIRLVNISGWYFDLLDHLIKFGEFDLFNGVIGKFTEEYDCVSYEKHGELMIKYGLNDLATESFIKAIELNSTNSKIYSYIAEKFVKINEVDDALSFAFTALDIDKNNAEAYDIISNIYEASGDTDKVREIQMLRNEIR